MKLRSGLARASAAVFMVIAPSMDMSVVQAAEPSAELSPADDGALAELEAVNEDATRVHADATARADVSGDSGDAVEHADTGDSEDAAQHPDAGDPG
jgi:hypothetical protein